MEITWYGHSCFRIRGRGCAAVTDPYDPALGVRLQSLQATLVTISHDHPGHNYDRGVRRSAYVITGPGEYEVGGVFVIGVATYHDTQKGAERGKNTAYLIEIEDVNLCHLGDLGHIPTQEQIEQFNDVDVLFVPVGGRNALSGARAAEVVGLIEPKIVIPMHYKTEGLDTELSTVTRFLSEMGVEPPEVQPALTITKSSLPEETQIVLLEPRT